MAEALQGEPDPDHEWLFVPRNMRASIYSAIIILNSLSLSDVLQHLVVT